jgi:aspartyl protease family protein
MLRSTLGMFFVIAVASLALVSYLTKQGGALIPNAPASPPHMPALAAPRSNPTASRQMFEPQAEIAADRSGHYVTDALVDGRDLRMLVDTGATWVTLTSEDAAALGLHPAPADYHIEMATANGIARAAPVRLRRMEIGGVQIYDIDALISQPGALRQSLLGMSALRKLRSFEVSAGRLILKQ